MLRNFVWLFVLLPLALYAVYHSLRINDILKDPAPRITETASLEACASALTAQRNRFGQSFQPSTCEAVYPGIRALFKVTAIEYSSGTVKLIRGTARDGREYSFEPRAVKK